ncbi:sulfate ABC transporter substrate-binding protein [Aphanothece hegewaldii CCALA 016]|uniref:Sulfate-binding protein n=1 Tax=Aphanothece hegewaldii CCALA 016 TaxID=2107694 RepID=A0A2T1LU55_9CHRO|nr:sulfate ABC transporter substrate-binding protein [Aphanothece hegewaldii]PSF34993.1 sulfate ABC transporter substrate-binding protein [Aphanothece hegewaldii CCALA 016]
MTKPSSMVSVVLMSSLLGGMLISCSSPNTSTPNAGTSQSATNTSSTKPVTLTLVSYAVTQSAYEKIIPKFVEQWKAKTGQDVVFEQSYGGSGSQTRAVIDGLEADVVALALALDTKKIEKAGLIQPGWEKELPNDSIVHRSVAALVERDGKLNVKKWSDLARDDIKVITANPKTSGGARWNFLALWGSVTQAGGTPQQATTFIEKVLKNAPVLPKDAREASDVFYKQGQGNVLINYENEVLLAEQKGEKVPYVVPTDYNISIDNPVTVVDANVDKHGTRQVAEAFTQFLYTPEAQREFAQVGFRPVDTEVTKEFASKYPTVKNLFTVKDLGGWSKIQQEFFEDDATFDKIMNKLNKS